MLALMRVLCLVLVFIVVEILATNNFKSSIRCYIKFQEEETKVQSLNLTVGHAFHHLSIITHVTPEGDLCSNVGCVCFSYKSVCTASTPGPKHSPCTDDEQRDRVLKWHHGFESSAKCAKMQQQQHTYNNLVCCESSFCNNQSDIKINFIEMQVQNHLVDIHSRQNQQSSPTSQSSQQNMDNPQAYPVESHQREVLTPPHHMNRPTYYPVVPNQVATESSPHRYHANENHRTSVSSTTAGTPVENAREHGHYSTAADLSTTPNRSTRYRSRLWQSTSVTSPVMRTTTEKSANNVYYPRQEANIPQDARRQPPNSSASYFCSNLIISFSLIFFIYIRKAFNQN